MAATQDEAARDEVVQRAAYWPVPIARAIPLAGLALVITFSTNHSAHFGLLSFGVFGIVGGIVVAVMAYLRLGSSRVRSYLVAQGAITFLAGALALALNNGGVRALFFTLTFFAAITGFLELYSGLRSRRRFVASGDWVAVGAFTALAALVFLLVPPDYHDAFTADGVHGVIDAAVMVVGLLGAYAAIVAVYLVIAGLSAKWGTQSKPAEASAHTATNEETKA